MDGNNLRKTSYATEHKTLIQISIFIFHFELKFSQD